VRQAPDKRIGTTLNTTLIQTPEALDQVIEEISHHDVIAVDTEFIREKTYYAQLCLIQIAYGDRVALIDPLAPIDLDRLSAVFCESDILKVFHSGQQDLEILYHVFKKPVRPLFDTQCAAALLGTAEQISYSGLVKMILDVDLRKIGSFSQWAHRPLSSEQLSYASDDVSYLLRAFPLIRRKLAELGRLSWLEEEFSIRQSEQYVADIEPEQAYLHLKRVATLRPRQLAVAREVTAWRQRQAVSRDRPRRHILPDETIIEIARKQPRTAEGLESIRGLTAHARRNTSQILRAVQEGLSLPDDRLPCIDAPKKPSTEIDASVRLAAALVSRRAKEHHIAPHVLASSEMLEEFVRTRDAQAQLMQGWRKMLIGNELKDLLDGTIALYLKDGKVDTVALRQEGCESPTQENTQGHDEVPKMKRI